MAAELGKIAEVKAVVEGNTKFDANLYQALKPSNPLNMIYSPLSLSAVMAMIKIGSKGKTSEEMNHVLHFPESNDQLAYGISKILASFQDSEGYTLAAANRVYTQQNFQLNPQYQKKIEESFGAKVEQLDFSNAKQSAVIINDWVKNTTRDKIKDLITEDMLNDLTRIVLVNGVYFKGDWANKFDPKETTKQPFHTGEKEKVDVDMMFRKTNDVHYGELKEFRASAVALPYKGGRLVMLVILPEQQKDLQLIESGLGNLSPKVILSQLYETTDLHLWLPKFKIESSFSLAPILSKMGMATAFSENADFSGISKAEVPLSVTEVVQKAFVEVNEEGTEAAAATGVVMMLRMMPMVTEFRADHPFVFQIVDTHTNLVLFTGTVKNPSSSK